MKSTAMTGSPKSLLDFGEFTVVAPLTRTSHRCRFHTLTLGVSPRHSDTADVKFLVNGKGVVIALPHAALAEFRRRHGRGLSDVQVVQVAGLFLRESLEKGVWNEAPLVAASRQETLELAEKLYGPVFRGSAP